jgi:hypothetical protein
VNGDADGRRVNHQIPRQPVVGRAAIEDFQRQTCAGGPLTCTPINLVIEGTGQRWSGPTRTAFADVAFRVRDGLIARQRGYWDSAQLRAVHPDVHDD